MGSEQEVDALLEALQAYFSDRAYAVKALDRDRDVVTWEGFVRPSLPLALLLSFLATIGLFCLSLVLLLAVPAVGPSWFALLLFAPAAGSFYWQRAGRLEEVSYRVSQIEAQPDPNQASPDQASPDQADPDQAKQNLAVPTPAAPAKRLRSMLSISAHRDEILALQGVLTFQELGSS